jgi:hypothetical protein
MQPGYAPQFADETDPGRLVKYYIHGIYSQHCFPQWIIEWKEEEEDPTPHSNVSKC